MLRNADVAMYRAKERGPSRIEIYREDDEQNVVSRLRTSNELHRAIERNELELHYQPFVDLHTETLVGMEALVRWRHPTRGLLLPQEFIPLAEDSGMIVPLGAWVLNEACRQTAEWHDSAVRIGPGQRPAQHLGECLRRAARRPWSSHGRWLRRSRTQASTPTGSGWRSPRAP